MNLEYFFIGAAGAFVLELMMLPEYRSKLTPRRFRKLLGSREYWIIALGLIIGSGLTTWLMNSGQHVPHSTLFAYGIAARSVVRQLGRGGGALTLGPAQPEESRITVGEVLNPK